MKKYKFLVIWLACIIYSIISIVMKDEVLIFSIFLFITTLLLAFEFWAVFFWKDYEEIREEMKKEKTTKKEQLQKFLLDNK